MSDNDSEAASDRMLEVRYEFTPRLPEMLSHLKTSLMVTTYQAGKLLVLGVHDGQLRISFTGYDQPMGLAVSDEKLVVGTRKQMNFLAANRDVAPSVAPAGSWDVCYVPRSSTWTGSIHGHDLAWGDEGLWVVNTLFSCLCTLHDDYSFVPCWSPPFISQLIDQDRCHLNGLAMDAGRPRTVSAMAESDTPAGWRPTKATSGVLIDVASSETIARGFSMPHSPRWYQGRLWALDSGRGALVTVDPATGRFDTVETFPGYTRGLSFSGQFAFVGLSKIRETSVFGGVPIAEHRHELRCGIGVVDLLSGRTVAVFQFLSGVTEIFAVEAVQGVACPYVAGASLDGREHDVWIVPPPGSVPSPEARLPWFATSSTRSSATTVKVAANAPVSSGSAAKVQGRTRDGLSLEDWLARHPDDAAAWIDLGNLRQEQDRQPEAVGCYERAVAANPQMSAARQNLGYLLFNQGFPEKAHDVYRDLLTLDPSPMNRLLAASVLPIVYQSVEDMLGWREEQTQALQAMVADGAAVDASAQLVPTSFFWPYQGENDRRIMALRGRIIRGDTSMNPRLQADRSTANQATQRTERLRVGFLSAYFRNHTIGRLNIGRIENLDRSKFHVTVLSAFGGKDDFTARFQSAADEFVTVPHDVRAAIQTIRRANLDVLIFADVGMDSLCSTLAYSRLAPVQCVTWGHPETTGSSEIDFFLSSELLETVNAESHYTEKLVQMPLPGTWYERPETPRVSDRSFPGIPDGAKIYCCPQSLFKFHPDNDHVFHDILKKDPAGVLVMIEGRVPEWTQRLRARWSKTMSDVMDRVLFLPPQPHHEYLRLLKISDVVLDPLHFGGGNSSYEALAMGTPVVTLPSEFLRGRITAALYARMGLTDCVVSTPEDYVQRAVRISNDTDFRQRIVEQIQSRSSILFENIEEVRCFEQSLLQCADRI